MKILVLSILICGVLFKLFTKNKEVRGEESKNYNEDNFIQVTIKPGVEPLVRAKLEEPVEKFLTKNNFGEVTGGGTMMGNKLEDGSTPLEFSDTEIYLNTRSKEVLVGLVNIMKTIKYPKDITITLWHGSKDCLEFSSVIDFGEYILSLDK